MALTKGMYIRTIYGIGKIISLEGNSGTVRVKVKRFVLTVPPKKYKTYSFNSFDVLEVGDIVTTNNLCGEITKIDKKNDRIWTTCYGEEYCSIRDIKELLTKEQFRIQSYRIGE